MIVLEQVLDNSSFMYDYESELKAILHRSQPKDIFQINIYKQLLSL